MVEFQNDQERNLFYMACVVLVLGILSFALLLTGNRGIIFYVIVLAALVVGFYFAYSLSQSEKAARNPPAEEPKKKAQSRYR
jgi:uncharacterized membrane protein YfcA